MTPRHGDVLITSRDGIHEVSIFAGRAHFTFKSLSRARDVAQRWINSHPGASLWHQNGDATHLMAIGGSAAHAAALNRPSQKAIGPER